MPRRKTRVVLRYNLKANHNCYCGQEEPCTVVLRYNLKANHNDRYGTLNDAVVVLRYNLLLRNIG